MVCAQKESSKPGKKNVYAELAKAPKKAAARRNPLENDRDAVAAGANLFDQHCAECHGEMAEGGRKAESACRSRAASHSRNALLDPHQRRGPPRHARLVQAARTAALAACELCQITQRRPKELNLEKRVEQAFQVLCQKSTRNQRASEVLVLATFIAPRASNGQWYDNRLPPIWG